MLTGLGIDEVFSRTASSGTSSFLTAALGSTLALADGNGTVQTSYTYDPFGTPTVTGATSSNTQQYTGRESDGTGLQYNRARYYSPTLQRFISEDPAGFGGGDVNLYAYVGNNPATLTDPSGLTGGPDPADYQAITDWQVSSGGIPMGGAAPEWVPEATTQAGLAAEAEATAAAAEGPIYGPFLPVEPPAGAGAFGPAGEGGMFCPETEGNGNAGGPRFIVNGAGEILDTTRITIPEGKFGYLLDPTDKGGIFGKELGFDSQSLGPALRQHLIDNFENITEGRPMPGGGKTFVVRGPITGPDGVTRNILAVWGVDPDGKIRLITAY